MIGSDSPMTSIRWDDLEGITPWRTPNPRPSFELFILPSPDPSVADMLLLSGSIPLAVHLYPPPPDLAPPYVTVEPLGATETTRAPRVRVTLVRDGGSEERVVPWDADDYDTRVAFGDVVRDYAAQLAKRGG